MSHPDTRSFLLSYRGARKLSVTSTALGWECEGGYRQWCRLGYDKYDAIAAVHWHQAKGGSVVNASPVMIDNDLKEFLGE